VGPEGGPGHAGSVLLVPVVWFFAGRGVTAWVLPLYVALPALHFASLELAARLSSSAPDVG
jgi:hypothetical protein